MIQNSPLDFDDLPNGVIVVRDGAGILAANSAMLEMLGCDRAWLIGRSLSSILTRPAAVLYHASFYAELRGKGHVTETYLDFRDKRGHDVPALCTGRVRVGVDTSDVVISATRMTERRRFEEDLLRTRRITEQIPGVVYQFLQRADGTRCIPYASESMREMFGLAPTHVAKDARVLLETLHPDDVAEFGDSLSVSAEKWKPWRHQFRARRAKDAPFRWIEGTALPDRLADGSIVWHGFLQDVTDRKIVDDALRAKEASDQANRAKSDFLARVSHELRTPLNAILGFAQTLSLDNQHPLLSTQQERVLHIEEAGRDLLELIDEVLDITRVETGEVRLKPGWIDLRHLFEHVLSLVEGHAQRGRVLLRATPQAELRVFADPARLGQVLTNLVSNAVKYNREGGSVTVSAAAEKERLIISIQDTGPGLSEDQLSHLFEPFNRLGAERSAVQGTGLGLVIVKRLIEAMDGSLVVSSSLGVGSTFRILLPCKASDVEAASDAARPVASPVPARSGRRRTARILYVEDNPINALVMQAICELSQGLDLHVEGTGRAAIAWIREHPIDLLLLDMNLPDFEGIALLHEMRIACPRHFPKAVAVSADALPQYLEAAKLAGFSDYWTKPLDVGRTLESFDVMLRRDHRNDAQLNK